MDIVSSQQIGECPPMPQAAITGCDAAYNLVVNYEADFYLCTDDQAQATADGCPKPAWQFLQRSTLKNIKIDNWQHHFSGKDIVRAGWQSLFGDVAGSILFSFFADDMMDCLHGSTSGCAWAYASYFPLEGALSDITKAVKALDAAARTGSGFEDAYTALRGLEGLSPLAREGIGAKVLEQLYETCTKRSRATFGLSANNACEGMIPYAGSELAVVAYKFRVASGLRYKFGRNIAVARVPGWAAATGAKDDFVVFSRATDSPSCTFRRITDSTKSAPCVLCTHPLRGRSTIHSHKLVARRDGRKCAARVCSTVRVRRAGPVR
ncbi:hypothetical protein [Streptomyces achromogenes]|uniref:hypothetical protein n=1 Tax=Streptomyces achromogenes TaxID=67255 RepID=UPI0036F68FB9